MAVLWDGGYWYAARPVRKAVQYVNGYDDETGEAIDPPIVTAGGDGAREADVPPDCGSRLVFGPFNHADHGWMYLVKARTEFVPPESYQIRELTKNAMWNLVGSRQNFERLRGGWRA